MYRFRYDDGTFHSKWETSDSLAKVSVLCVHSAPPHACSTGCAGVYSTTQSV